MDFGQLLEQKIAAYNQEAELHLTNHHRCTAAGLALQDALNEYRAKELDGKNEDKPGS